FRGSGPGPAVGGRRLPDAITPFTVLALLRDIENEGRLGDDARRELAETISASSRRSSATPVRVQWTCNPLRVIGYGAHSNIFWFTPIDCRATSH
ncbi:MAG: hypothetical protein F6K44_24725, partial [Moorea sp. SIO3E2]|nr:hypothetical protein [Moorena sp. SIO3E2]